MQLKKIVLASANVGKIRELQPLLLPIGVEVLLPTEVSKKKIIFPEETGSTFAENASLKARSIAAQTQLPTIADDSGLCVDILNGEPGIKSARWHSGSDLDRCSALIKKLKNLKQNKWQFRAHFISVICLFLPETNEEYFFEGRLDGSIAEAPKGDQGFGYDPIFLPANYDKTLAELGSDVKNKISHRAKAIEKLINFLSGN